VKLKIFIGSILLGASVLFLSCYEGHGLSPSAESVTNSGVSGRITFIGTWPDSTKEVRIAVLEEYPKGIENPDELFSFVLQHLVTFSDTIPRYVDHYDYELTLEPGEYGWILVAWFPEIENYLLGVKELGAYYETEQDPSPVTVVRNYMTKGIDIEAVFDNVYQDTPFF
jgi:hypothetical protein